MSKQKVQLIRIVFGAVLAAMVFVVTMFRFPLLGSKVHFANAVCLLSGLLLGPVWGGFAAGMGSMLYDLFLYNEGIINLLITFVSKFAMAWVAAMLFRAVGTDHVDHVCGGDGDCTFLRQHAVARMA